VYTSTARKKLQSALKAAQDPAQIANLTGQLAKLMDAEGRARGRRQRASARAEKAAKAAANTPPAYDPNEIFEIDEPAPAILTPQPPPAKVLSAPPEPEPAPEPPRRILPENGTGWTRTLAAGQGPIWWDRYSSCWVGDGGPDVGPIRAGFDRNFHVTEDDEAAANEFEARGAIEFRGGHYFNEQHERDKAEKAEIEMWRKVYGR
jgi:hypothetical protein